MRIAIVDDEAPVRLQLSDYVHQYANENHLSVEVQVFSSAAAFLEAEKSGFDILLLDIEMDDMDGMTLARDRWYGLLAFRPYGTIENPGCRGWNDYSILI